MVNAARFLRTLFFISILLIYSQQVWSQATHLSYYATPAKGNIATNLPPFQVQALNASNAIDTTFHGLITLTKVSGTGAIAGIDTCTAIKGVATFGHVNFTASGTYVIAAAANGLTSANSTSIVISGTTVFGNPSKLIYFWDFNQTLPYEGTGQSNHPADSLGTATLPLLPDYSANGNKAQIRYYRPSGLQPSAVRYDSTLVNAQNGSFLFEYNNNDYRYFINPDSLFPGGNMCLHANNPSINSYFYLTLPTKGYQNINLNFALTGSGSTMANYLVFSYSADGGKTWSGLTSAMDTFKVAGVHYPDSMLADNPTAVASKWIPVSLNFSSGQLISDNPNFLLRFMLGGPANHSAAGYTAFDNFALSGDSLCPTFSVQTTNVSVCPLGRVQVSAQVVGGVENTCQWQENTGGGFANITDGGVYSGSKTVNLVLTGVPASMSGRTYRLLVNSGLCKQLISNVSTLTVRPLPTVTATIVKPIVCYGDTDMLQGGGAQSYTWSGGLYDDRLPFNAISSGTYTVTGTDIYGCVNTASATLTVNPLPKVTAASSAVKNQVCLGSQLTLTGGGASTYAWSNNQSNGVAFVPSASQKYIVTGTDNNGCKDTASIFIKIDSLPKVVPLATNTSVCIGNKVALRGSSPTATSFAWSGGITNNTPFLVALGSKTYTVTATDSNNCKSTASIAITGFGPPTVVAHSSAPAVCAGSSVLLYGSGAKNYQWTNGVQDSVPYTPTAAQTYTVTGVDSNGCSATQTIAVGYNQLPIVAANADQTEICQGTAILLYGSGATTYVWSGNIVDSVSFTPTISTTYTLTGTDNNGCKGRDSIAITVDTLPVLKYPSTYTLCDGKTATLGGTANPNNSYQWTPTSDLSCYDCSNPVLTANGNVTYTLTATGNASGCSSTQTVTIKTNALPSVSATASDSALCAGDNEVLTATGANRYSWTGGVINKVPFTPTASGSYTVTGTDGNNCTASSTVSIVVNPLPLVTASTTNYNVCAGLSVKLSGGGASTYSWNPQVNNDSSFVPTSTQTYTVTGTDKNGCTATATVTITETNCTGIENPNDEVAIVAYPNPVATSLHISNTAVGDVVFFYNIVGSKVKVTIVPEANVAGSYSADLSTLPDGIYIVEVFGNNANRKWSQKIMVHHE